MAWDLRSDSTSSLDNTPQFSLLRTHVRNWAGGSLRVGGGGGVVENLAQALFPRRRTGRIDGRM